jgi:hypothetical protein
MSPKHCILLVFLLAVVWPVSVPAQTVYPPGDVNGDGHVTGADSLLLNQVLLGLRSSNHPVFAVTGFANGDVNRDGQVSGGDSLLINQVLVGLRSHVITKVTPAIRTNGPCQFIVEPSGQQFGPDGGTGSISVTAIPPPDTSLDLYGIGFPTNAGLVTAIRIDPPVDLLTTNFSILSPEHIHLNLPWGGVEGLGTVYLLLPGATNVLSFAIFENR